MFRTLGLFSGVACPNLHDSQKCPVERCLYSHALESPRKPPNADPAFNETPQAPQQQPPKNDVDPRLRALVQRQNSSKPGGPATSEASQALSRAANRAPLAEPAKKGAEVTAAKKTEPVLVKQHAALKSKPAPPDTQAATAAAAALKHKVPAPKTKAAASQSNLASSTTSPAPKLSSKLKRPAPDGKDDGPAKKRPVSASGVKTAPLTINPRPVQRPPAAHDTRYKYIVKLHQELCRLRKNPKGEEKSQALIRKALDMEEEVATTKQKIYQSAMGRMIARLMKLSPEEYAKEQREEAKKVAGPAAPAQTPHERIKQQRELSNSQPPIETGIPKEGEVVKLKALIHGEDMLREYEYNLTPPTDAEIATAREGLEAANGYEKCDRCGSRFQVFPGRRGDGALTSGGECTYHPGRRQRPPSGTAGRIAGTPEQVWSCCLRSVGMDAGCEKCEHHVHKVEDPKRLAITFPFITTPFNPKVTELRAIAFDCEMGYTTHGMEVIRLTATAFPSGAVIIDALVRPQGEVLDLNTRFSGVSMEMMNSAPPYSRALYPDAATTPLINPTALASPSSLTMLPSPLAAREALLAYVNPGTILVGHALNNDLNVLRLCHKAVVDTAIVFPHARGFPIRNKLKYLVHKHLAREIQIEDGAGTEAGHDSAVDARCAAELCRLKIKWEVMKEKRPAPSNSRH